MSRSAKRLQVIDGLLLIVNLIFPVFPFYIVRQENYADQVGRPYELVVHMMEYPMQQRILLSVLLLLPLALSLILGIVLIVKKKKHLMLVLGNLIILGLYVALFVMDGQFVPEVENAVQRVERSYALYIPIVCSALAMAAGIVALALPAPVQQVVKAADSLDGLDEIRQRQNNPRNFTDESGHLQERKLVAPMPVNTVSNNAMQVETGGMLIGLRGVFAGAQIPLADGEPIRMGRDTSNHLVFTDQEKVSRNHCIIMWLAEKRKYQIKDMSSNGSFINENEEEPIPQNIPIYLEPGTVLDIGDSSNRFRLG